MVWLQNHVKTSGSATRKLGAEDYYCSGSVWSGGELQYVGQTLARWRRRLGKLTLNSKIASVTLRIHHYSMGDMKFGEIKYSIFVCEADQ